MVFVFQNSIIICYVNCPCVCVCILWVYINKMCTLYMSDLNKLRLRIY